MEWKTGEIKQSIVFSGVWKSKSQREGNVMLLFRCNSLTFLRGLLFVLLKRIGVGIFVEI